jgi:lipid A ethanolaminephosphotransferase
MGTSFAVTVLHAIGVLTMNVSLVKSWKSLLLFYSVAFLAFISLDPGLINWLKSLQYDLHEGQFPLVRVLVLLVSSAIVATPLMMPNVRVRILYMLWLLVLSTIGLSFRYINGQFTHWEAMLTINELGFASAAITEFIGVIILAIAFTVAALGVLYWLRPRLSQSLRSTPNITSVALLLPWLMPALYLMVANGGYLMTHFALPMKVASSLAYVAQQPLYQGERSAVLASVNKQTSKYHVMLIVDESIRGDLLSINGGPASTTPYLNSLIDQQKPEDKLNLHNYGVVNATANCSATSNLLLRTGIAAQRLPRETDALFKQPNIFQYANTAGYHSVYMDAQVEGRRLNNLFTQREIDRIDEYWVIKNHHDLPEHKLDQTMAADIGQRLAVAEEPQFYYINKSGTHFPYAVTFPAENYPVSTGKKETYIQALNWSVDEFFKVLIPELSKANLPVVVIYTSDHGQGLGEQGNHSTHCLPKAVPIEQALVPLLLISVGDDEQGSLIEPFKQQVGAYSQFQVFPTMLTLLGYPSLSGEYGVDLSQPWDQPQRVFLSGDISGRGQLYKNPFNWTPQH